jgi:hypothetical protein
MRTVQRKILFLSLSSLLVFTSIETQAESEGFWQKLWHLIYQEQPITVNLASALAKATEKSDSSDSNNSSHLYLVNTSTSHIQQWPTAAGAKQPTLCPDGKDLFYRLAGAVYKESLQLRKGELTPAAKPQQVEGLEVQNIYACSSDEQGQPVLWIESMDEKIAHIRIKADSHERVSISLDPELNKEPLKELAEKFGLLRGMRRDGYFVWVRNQKLMGQKPLQSSMFYVVNPSAKPFFQFSGQPAWVDNTDYIFTTASEK